jgi:hypothetical protein
MDPSRSKAKPAFISIWANLRYQQSLAASQNDGKMGSKETSDAFGLDFRPEWQLPSFRFVDFAPAAIAHFPADVLESYVCFGLGAVIRCVLHERQLWAVPVGDMGLPCASIGRCLSSPDRRMLRGRRTAAPRMTGRPNGHETLFINDTYFYR